MVTPNIRLPQRAILKSPICLDEMSGNYFLIRHLIFVVSESLNVKVTFSCARKGIQFNQKKQKAKQTTAEILISISLLFIVINRRHTHTHTLSLPLTRGITFSRCQDRRPNTQTNSYSSAYFSITHCTLCCTIIITLKLFHDVLTKQKSFEGIQTGT